MKLEKPHAVVAVKPLSESSVEVRYGDGSPTVILEDTTPSEVIRQVTAAKAKKSDTDSA